MELSYLGTKIRLDVWHVDICILIQCNTIANPRSGVNTANQAVNQAISQVRIATVASDSRRTVPICYIAQVSPEDNIKNGRMKSAH
jgi:hypothetical protein